MRYLPVGRERPFGLTFGLKKGGLAQFYQMVQFLAFEAKSIVVYQERI